MIGGGEVCDDVLVVVKLVVRVEVVGLVVDFVVLTATAMLFLVVSMAVWTGALVVEWVDALPVLELK